MKIFVKKTLQGLVPASRNEAEVLQDAKLKLGEYYEVELRQPRNIGFHRKFFALVNICFENQEIFTNIDDLRDYLIMKAGFYYRIKTPKGELFRPKSISFAKMDEIEFGKVYDAVLSQVILLLDCSNDDLINALAEF